MLSKEKLNKIQLYGLYKDLYNGLYTNLSDIITNLKDSTYFSDIDKFDSFQKINNIYYDLKTNYDITDNEDKFVKSMIYSSIRYIDVNFNNKANFESFKGIDVNNLKRSFMAIWPFYKQYMHETTKLSDMTNLKPFPFKNCVNDGTKVYDDAIALNITSENKQLVQSMILSVQEFAENRQKERDDILKDNEQIELDFENEMDLEIS